MQFALRFWIGIAPWTLVVDEVWVRMWVGVVLCCSMVVPDPFKNNIRLNKITKDIKKTYVKDKIVILYKWGSLPQ